jgi:hypothetical protein
MKGVRMSKRTKNVKRLAAQCLAHKLRDDLFAEIKEDADPLVALNSTLQRQRQATTALVVDERLCDPTWRQRMDDVVGSTFEVGGIVTTRMPIVDPRTIHGPIPPAKPWIDLMISSGLAADDDAEQAVAIVGDAHGVYAEASLALGASLALQHGAEVLGVECWSWHSYAVDSCQELCRLGEWRPTSALLYVPPIKEHNPDHYWGAAGQCEDHHVHAPRVISSYVDQVNYLLYALRTLDLPLGSVVAVVVPADAHGPLIEFSTKALGNRGYESIHNYPLYEPWRLSAGWQSAIFDVAYFVRREEQA